MTVYYYGERANTATADSNQTPPTETPNVVPVPQDAKLSQTKVGVLDKTVVAPADRADAGDVINYTITAKNDGNVTLTRSHVDHPFSPPDAPFHRDEAPLGRAVPSRPESGTEIQQYQ